MPGLRGSARGPPGLPIEEMVVRAHRAAAEATTGAAVSRMGFCQAGRYGVEVMGDGTWPDCYVRATTDRAGYPLCDEHAAQADAAADLARRVAETMREDRDT